MTPLGPGMQILCLMNCSGWVNTKHHFFLFRIHVFLMSNELKRHSSLSVCLPSSQGGDHCKQVQNTSENHSTAAEFCTTVIVKLNIHFSPMLVLYKVCTISILNRQLCTDIYKMYLHLNGPNEITSLIHHLCVVKCKTLSGNENNDINLLSWLRQRNYEEQWEDS